MAATFEELMGNAPTATVEAFDFGGLELRIRGIRSFREYAQIAQRAAAIRDSYKAGDVVATVDGQTVPLNDQVIMACLTAEFAVVEPPITFEDALVLSERHGAAFGMMLARINELSEAGIVAAGKEARAAIEGDPFPSDGDGGGENLATAEE